MKKLFRLVSGFFLVVFLTIVLLAAGDGKLYVYYVNVGQGDAEYIVFPDGSNMLIDGGPYSTPNTSNPLIYFLSDEGVNKIDRMMLSHDHSDHYSGLSAVYNYGISVSTYYDSFLGTLGPEGGPRGLAKSRSICINTTEKPNSITDPLFTITNSTPPVSVYLLHNGTAFYPNYLSENDLSLVIKIVFGQSTFFFGGDAGAGGSYRPLEGWLVNTYGDSLQADMYKVHHHGSSTSSSSTFLSKLRPRYAFIEVGKNSYGHPASDALSRIAYAIETYQKYPNGYANIYRTDLDGTIKVIADGTTNYSIVHYAPVPLPPSTGGTTDVVGPGVPARGTLSFIKASNNFFDINKIGLESSAERTDPFKLSFLSGNSGRVSLKIFTLRGELVYSLETDIQANYIYDFVWSGQVDTGGQVPPGVYVAYIETPSMKATKRVVVLR